MDAKRASVWPSDGRYSRNNCLWYGDDCHHETSIPQRSFVSRVRKSLSKNWGRKRHSFSSANNSHHFSQSKVAIESRDSNSGWLNYFAQRTLRRSAAVAAANDRAVTSGVSRPRKIRRTHFGEKEAIEDLSPLPEIGSPSSRYHGIRRSFSLPADEMGKLHLNLKRSASSKAVLHDSRYERAVGTGGFRTHEERIVEQTKDFCRDIILQALKRHNLCNRVMIERPATCDHWVTRDVQAICSELERRNLCLCNNISRQIGITLRSEEVLRKVFFEFAREVIMTDKEGDPTEKKRAIVNGRRHSRSAEDEAPRQKYFEITWGRIMAVFVGAGAFAVDCIKQGHSDLVSALIEFCGEFFLGEGVVDWILCQGGWETLCSVNSVRIKEPDVSNAWNILLLSACVIASLVLGVGLSNLTVGGM